MREFQRKREIKIIAPHSTLVLTLCCIFLHLPTLIMHRIEFCLLNETYRMEKIIIFISFFQSKNFYPQVCDKSICSQLRVELLKGVQSQFCSFDSGACTITTLTL